MNKTIRSTALSNNKGDPARTRSVNKHVQRWRTKASSTKRPMVEPKGPRIIGWQLDDLPKREKSPCADIVRPTKQMGGSVEERQDRAITALTTILAEIPPRWGSPVDPFLATSVPLTSEVFGFLRYFTESFLSAAIQTQVQNALSPKKVPASEHPTSRRIIQDCVADEKHMYCMLALTSHQIKYTIGQLPRMDRPEFYMAKAIELMRRALDDEDVGAMGQQAVLDITWMGTSEAYHGNYEGALTHYRIGLYIVESMGGWDMIDPFMREMCRIGDIFVSSLTLKPPMFGLEGDPGDMSGGFRAEIHDKIRVDRRMGVAFLELHQLWVGEMEELLADVLDVVQAAQFLWAFPDADVSGEDRDWVLQRSHALTHRLLCLVPQRELGTVDEAMAEVCRLCFVLWLFYVLAGTAGGGVIGGGLGAGGVPLKRARHMMPEHCYSLRRAVMRVDGLVMGDGGEDVGRWGGYDDILLWVLAFGTLSSKFDGCWFAKELGREAGRRGIFTFDSLMGLGSVGGYLGLERLEILTGRRVARVLIGGLVSQAQI